MKKQRHARVGVEKGFGPRHAFNAQEGAEAVPGPLPSVPQAPPDAGDKLRRLLIDQVVSPEARAEMAKNPAGLKALATYAGLGGALLSGGREEAPMRVGEGPILTRANRNGTTIRASFDATKPAPDPKALEQQFADAGHNVSVTKFGPDLVSATKGEHNFRIDVWDKNNRLSSDAAKAAMEGMFGADEPYRGQTQFEQAVPLEQRYGAAHEYGSKKLSDAELRAQEEPEHDRKGKTKVGAAKGFGPRHAENAKEGDLTEVNTDTVPAMLTPREAVLNRNAAELAGRPQIEALNAEGNELAKKGVDLAAKGQASVPPVKVPVPRVRGSGNVLKYVLPGELRREAAAGLPKLERGTSEMKTKPKQTKGGPQPAQQMPPMPPPRGSGGFYPPGMGFAEGSSQVGIGAENPSKVYDPREQIDYKAPNLDGFIAALHKEGQRQGLSTGQMSQIAQQIAGGFGGGGGGALGANYAAAGSPTPVYGESGYPSAIPVGGYQGGISDIGYPPFAAPNAVYHGDKGSNWLGDYDPAIMIPRLQGGSDDVGFYGNRRFAGGGPSTIGSGGGERFNYDKLLSGGYPGPNLNNPNDPANAPDLPPEGRSLTPQLDQFDTQTANYYRGLQGGFGGFGYQPSEGTPGFLQGSTRHMNAFDAQGYPYAQPVNSSDNPRPMPHWRPKSRS